ncbi:MAG TPA: hypothetical protein VFS20_07075 [Longimicrobium sp.]|nr:hypothetical protein [Longimicrobium sp.]
MPLLDAAFPAGAALPECARELLKALYPTVRWNEVTFHPVLPAYLLKFTNAAVTLPDPLSIRHIRIFVAAGKWNGGVMTRELLGLLVHEGYHVLQYQQRLGGIGLGPLRGFVVQYLAAAVTQGGGRRNRYEKPAYAHEAAFLRAWDRLAVKPCAPGGTPDTTRSTIVELLRIAPDLVKTRAEP